MTLIKRLAVTGKMSRTASRAFFGVFAYFVSIFVLLLLGSNSLHPEDGKKKRRRRTSFL